MNAVAAPVLHLPAAIAEPNHGLLRKAEDVLLSVTFLTAMALPLTEIVLRATLHRGIVGVGDIVQHLILVVGMLGAAVAARQDRLLVLAVAGYIKGRIGTATRFFSRVVAASVTVLLGLAAADFVGAERQAGNVLAYGLPIWVVELVLPVGFALIALRLARQAHARWFGQILAIVLVAAASLVLRAWIGTPGVSTTPLLIGLLLATLLGAPIFTAVGGAAYILLVSAGVPAASVAVDHYNLAANPSLPAIPMFVLAGYLLAESLAPKRLIGVFDALFGGLRGGAAVATVLACTFFTSFTGASGVTVLALGGLVMPLLLASHYSERSAMGLVTAAGLPGTLLMPALPLILYAIVAGVAMEDMFRGGILPTLLMVGIVTAWGIWRQPKQLGARAGFDPGRAGRAILDAKWELSIPLVPIVSLSSGLATPVESAALTALYAFVVTVLIRRDLDLLRDVPRVVSECGLVVGGILLVMGVALGLTDFLVDAQVPDRLVTWVGHAIGSRIGMLLALNVSLLAAGCLIEIYPAILILAPIVVHVGKAFAVHPVHLGIIFLANMELGYLTPLVGLNLFFASYRFGKPVAEIFRAVLPLFVALAVGVLIITYVPWLSTALLHK